MARRPMLRSGADSKQLGLKQLRACFTAAATQRHVLNLVCVHTTGHRTTNNKYIYIYHQDLQMFLIDTPDSGLKFFIKGRV